MPLIEIARTKTKDEAMAALATWRERHPAAAERLEPADVLVDGMRGPSSIWYRIRINLQHVPDDQRPSQEELIADYRCPGQPADPSQRATLTPWSSTGIDGGSYAPARPRDCSCSQRPAACSSQKPPPASTGGGGPVTITHAFGETTIPEPPKRVVSAGFTGQDDLLALGVVPVAVTNWFGDQPFGVWPWAQSKLGNAKPVVLNLDNGIQVQRSPA